MWPMWDHVTVLSPAFWLEIGEDNTQQTRGLRST